MKKFFVIFAIFTVLVGFSAIAFAASTNIRTSTNNKNEASIQLTDIKNTKYEKAVTSLISEGIVNGYSDKTFKPDNEITRAEMAKMLVTAAKLDTEIEKNSIKQIFSDVAKEHWALGCINVAYQNDYIEGYENGTFAPEDNVTYAEAITMVVRMLGYKSAVEAKGEWPDNYIKKAGNLKILNNVDYKNKNDDATRGDVAILVWNALNETKTYYKAGILEEVNVDKLGDSTVKIDGTEYVFKADDNLNIDIEEYLDTVIFYKLRQEKDEGYVTFISGVTAQKILEDDYDDYVEASDSGKVLFKNRGVESFKETFEDDFDDYIFIKFDFDPDKEEATNISLVTTSDKVNASDFEEFDRIYIDEMEEVTFVIEGLEEEKVTK